MTDFINEKIKEFNKNYCNVYSGDSGLGGNDPQESVDEFACYPKDVRKFITTAIKEAYLKGLEDVEAKLPRRIHSDIACALGKCNCIEKDHNQFITEILDMITSLKKGEKI